ncbi:DUF262 domain-containing protein [Nonomuraea sp. NPDC001023]|uniref:DUF262 domain-containing protein n=1 Tax=unclassified Nonomuraea TaxID=2593643 RepID=UPI00331F5905
MSEAELDPPVELDSEGRSTGVEREDPGDRIEAPFDPDRIDVQTRTPTIDLLLSRLRRRALDLEPDFQRKAGIWSDRNQSRLIESLLLRIPLPTLYASDTDEDVWVVVDGIQRLTTVARFVDPITVGMPPLILRDLEYLRQYEGCSYADLPGRLQTRISETELVVHLIRPGTPDEVKFNIFARINTGGRPLTRQELRHALIPGTARVLLKELAEAPSYLAATNKSVSPDRMDDREMVLRFLAFRLTEPNSYTRGDLDEFLRETMVKLNGMDTSKLTKLKRDFNRAMDMSKAIFGEYAFRKRIPGSSRRLPINKAIFEAVSVNLARRSDDDFSLLLERAAQVEANFIKLMDDAEFERAISQGTGDVAKVRHRFSTIDKMLRWVAR